MRENPVDKPKQNENATWSSDTYYNHVNSLHPPERHETLILDPVLANPASRESVLAVTNHVKQSTNIGKKSMICQCRLLTTSIKDRTQGNGLFSVAMRQ